MIFRVAIIVSVLFLSSCATSRFVSPPALRDGDLVGITQVSSKVDPEADTSYVRRVFEEFGLRVRFSDSLLSQSDVSFGSPDSARAARLQAMIEDPEIKAILMYRGGYGAVRVLDYVDLRKLRRSPKWIAGYSDVTVLHNALAKVGVQSLHSTMPASFSTDTIDRSMIALFDALKGKTLKITLPPHPLNQWGSAKGVITGGNLSIINALAGTDVDIDTKKGERILLVEEVGEKMYHIDRMFQNLYRSGKLAKVKAIIVGHFTNITGRERFNGVSPEELISQYTKKYNIPVVFGFPVGHEQDNLSLYMGRKVSVKVNENGAVIEYE